MDPLLPLPQTSEFGTICNIGYVLLQLNIGLQNFIYPDAYVYALPVQAAYVGVPAYLIYPDTQQLFTSYSSGHITGYIAMYLDRQANTARQVSYKTQTYRVDHQNSRYTQTAQCLYASGYIKLKTNMGLCINLLLLRLYIYRICNNDNKSILNSIF